MTETYEFQAEINQLMSLIINTFYTKKEIFLRELISNASDALDKSKYTRAQKGVEDDGYEGCVKMRADKNARTVCIEDTGVGMTRQELIDNLGTIAQSGTKGFMQKNEGTLIGQFGVGFYAAYLVADRVTVTTRTDDTETYTWESSAGGTFTIKPAEEEMDKRGTRIVLHMKEDADEYLDNSRLTKLIQTYSQFIQYPIYLEVEKTREVEDDEKEDEKEDEKVTIEDVTDHKDETDDGKKKTRIESYREWERQNEQKPLWIRPPSEITNDEYNEFYKAITGDWDGALSWSHIVAEGTLDFRGVVYVPKRAPFDLYDSTKKHNIKLFVRRVFVMDETEELVPEWLKFLRVMIDSEDLPLNISREMIQKNQIIKLIQKNLVKKCIEMFMEMARDKPDDYKTFYKNYSKCIKLGVNDEPKYKDKLMKLLRYTSSATINSEEMVSLDEYVGRMKKGQKGIYYITGETDKIIHESPFLEKLRSLDYEVLYMSDPIDEYVMQRTKEYEDKKFIDCARGGKILDEEEEEDEEMKEKRESEEKALCKRFQEVLGHQVDAVVVGTRMVDSPCCLVSSEYGWSANMERIMRAQTLRDNSQADFMTARKVMEVNPKHRIIKEVQKLISSETDELANDVINLLYESSLIDSGFTIETPKRFVKRINNMICLGLSLEEDPKEPPKEDDPRVKIEKMEDPNLLKELMRKNDIIEKNEGVLQEKVLQEV